MGVEDNVSPTAMVDFHCITDKNLNQQRSVGFSLKYANTNDILSMVIVQVKNLSFNKIPAVEIGPSAFILKNHSSWTLKCK